MEYIPLGGTLSVEEALIQASQALDITATIATENRDADRLSKTAKDWVKLADFMAALESHRKGETEPKKEKPPFGFVSNSGGDFERSEQLEIEFEDEEEDDVRDDEE